MIISRISAVMALLISYFVGIQTSGFTNGPVVCPFRILTGMPCPFCGTTRSIGNIFQGDLPGAWDQNPLGFLVLLATFAFIASPRSFRRLLDYITNSWREMTQQSQIVFATSISLFGWALNLPRMF